jgi:hypothetical protein
MADDKVKQQMFQRATPGKGVLPHCPHKLLRCGAVC